MRHLVLGTAGHIDHGKSALVEALTGTHPDRLDEEQRRGITIELGFADLHLGDERVLSFVDVPGHERFVRHMVAGATGIDAVLLVVAADQGVQPQTREHLEICSLLGIREGIVALTKCDLVDPDLQEVAALEVSELLEGTFLEDAPLVPVSAKSAAGLDALREALTALFDRVEPGSSEGVTRLPVDRSFVIRGFGTVVTGTLVSGALAEGEEVQVLPDGPRARIRGLQVHKQKVERAMATSRVAINLQGVDSAQVPRGSTIAPTGGLQSTRRIWARVKLLDSAPEALERGGPVRFHEGTSEHAATYRVLRIADDGDLLAELFLEDAAVLRPGDRFVLRRPAPVDTIGGGVVVDIHPPHRRDAREEDFDTTHQTTDALVRARVARAGASGKKSRELAAELGVGSDELRAAGESLRDSGDLVEIAGRWIDGECWRTLEAEALVLLERFHAADPLRTGMSREELRAAVSAALAQDSWRKMLEGLAAEEKVRLEADRVALAGHRVELKEADRKLSERIDREFRDAGLDPPDAAALAPEADRATVTRLIDLLIASGALVKINDGRLFHAAALDALLAKLRDYATTEKTIDVAAFKTLAGVTRKNAIPLLEHLDVTRVTRRVGNLREIL
ncbi:MAG: selenocysteine-specific translation elongation factor [bacterium]|nr:selenocysteine-specific translation elongation factor [bacterium]